MYIINRENLSPWLPHFWMSQSSCISSQYHSKYRVQSLHWNLVKIFMGGAIKFLNTGFKSLNWLPFTTNCIQKSPSWDANWSSDSRAIPRNKQPWPWSQKLITCPHPLPDVSVHVLPSFFFKIHFNINLSSLPKSYQHTFPSSLLNPKLSIYPHTCYMPHQSHTLQLGHPNIGQGVWITKLLTMQFSPVSCPSFPPP